MASVTAHYDKLQKIFRFTVKEQKKFPIYFTMTPTEAIVFIHSFREMTSGLVIDGGKENPPKPDHLSLVPGTG